MGTAGNVTVRLNLNSTGYSAGITAAQRQMRALGKAASDAGREGASSMQAASGAIRLLEGDVTRNVRAVERFISSFKGLSSVLQTVFPLVGAAALAGVIFKVGEEALTAVKKVQQMPQAISNGFREMNASAQTANDTLRVTNDRLENEIAKLQGKPQNNIALAIDEARVAADKFAESLDRDNQKVAALLQQHNIGGLAAIFTNRQSTNTISGTINSYNQQLSDLGTRYDLAVHGNTADAGGSPAEILKQINDMRASAIAKMRQEIVDAQAAQNRPSFMNSAGILAGTGIKGPNQSGVIAEARGELGMLLGQGESQTEGQRNSTDEALKAKLQAAKDYAASIKAAQEAIVAQWRKDLDEQKTTFDDMDRQEAQFWVRRMEEARKGSFSYIAALDEANKAIARMRGENIRGGKEFDKLSAESYTPGAMDQSRGDNSEMASQGRGVVGWLKAQNEAADAARANATAIAEAAVQMQVATGRMSNLDAAQKLAAVHAQDYKDAIDEVNAAIASAQSLPEGSFKKETLAELAKQKGNLNTSYQIQSANDQQAVYGNTVTGAAKDALNRMTQDFDDLAANLKQVIPQMVNNLNDNLTALITGTYRKGQIGKTFEQAGQGLVKSSLQKLEAQGLKALHLGGGTKPTGTQGDPIYTKDASQAASGVAAILGGQGGSQGGGGFMGLLRRLGGSLAGLFGGGSAAAAGGAAGGLSTTLETFAGALAGGGDVMANHSYLVGEKGPEMFMSRTAGRIIPNHQLGSGGDHTHYHFNIQGNDPAAMEAMLRRAAPQIVAGAVQTQHQHSMRRPQGR